MALRMGHAGFWEQGKSSCWEIYSPNKHEIKTSLLWIFIQDSNTMGMKAVALFVWWGFFCAFKTKAVTSSCCSPQIHGQTSFLWWELKFLLCHIPLTAKVFLKASKYLRIHNISANTTNRRLPRSISDSNSPFFAYESSDPLCFLMPIKHPRKGKKGGQSCYTSLMPLSQKLVPLSEPFIVEADLSSITSRGRALA